MQSALEAMRWLLLLGFVAGGGWILYQAALIGDAQRRRQDGAPRGVPPSPIRTTARRDNGFDIPAL